VDSITNLDAGTVLSSTVGQDPSSAFSDDGILFQSAGGDLLVSINGSAGNDYAAIQLLNQSRPSVSGFEFLDLPQSAITGTTAADTIRKLDDNDVVSGIGGNDTLRTTGGNDTLYGSQSDTIADELVGGLGDNVLYGGTGADSIYFEANGGQDVVVDVEVSAGDKLLISGTLADGLVVTSAAELIARPTDTADGYAEIDLGGTGNYVRLIGISTAELTEDYFQIV